MLNEDRPCPYKGDQDRQTVKRLALDMSEEQGKDVVEAKGRPGVEEVKTEGKGSQEDGGGEGIDVPDTRGSRKPQDVPRHRPGAQHAKTGGDEPKELFSPTEFGSLYYKKFDSMGRAVIINNLKDKTGLPQKLTELKGVLKDLGFKGIHPKRQVLAQKAEGEFEFTKLSKADIIALMQEASSEDYTSFHCFLAIILSYGKDGVLECEFDDYRSPGRGERYPQVELTTLQECFKDKGTLNLKPKLFFIQTEKRRTDLEQHDGLEEREGITTRKIPREADFFTYLYDMTFIHEDPFMFLDTLKTALERHVRDEINNNRKPLEINKLTIRMNGMLEERLQKCFFEFDDEDFKIPCVTSLLTKYMYFNQ